MGVLRITTYVVPTPPIDDTFIIMMYSADHPGPPIKSALEVNGEITNSTEAIEWTPGP